MLGAVRGPRANRLRLVLEKPWHAFGSGISANARRPSCSDLCHGLPNLMSNLYALDLAQSLIRCPSVTPLDEGAISILIDALSSIGFDCSDHTFGDDGGGAIRNLYARYKSANEGPNFCFAGHTDVVPPGSLKAWHVAPFSATVENGELWGRGASDMKGAIAAFIAAAKTSIEGDKVTGSLSLLITGDEEGAAVNGTRKLLREIQTAGEKIDHCLVGEPTNPQQMGEMIKVGRRGSINCWLTVKGQQGHVAYPERACNPIPDLLRKLTELSLTPLDDGYARFQPSSLQITEIQCANPAHNVIPESAAARFNIRFNPNWTGQSIETWLREKLDATISETTYNLECIVSGEAFLTTDDAYIELISGAVEAVTGRKPELSTSGGTSDARFIKDFAPVAEFGLVGATMHKTNERVPVQDIATLQNIYEHVIAQYFIRYGK